MDVNVRYCRREGHELGPLFIQDPKSENGAPKKLEVPLYVSKKTEQQEYSSDKDIVTLLYFWEFPTANQDAEVKAVFDKLIDI
jgi:hypothetical protein